MAVPNATLEAVMKVVQLDLLATAPRREKVPERVPSKVHTGIEPAEEERPPAAVYLPDGAKAVSIVRAPSPDSDEYAEATVVHLKRFTGYVTDEDDSTPSSSSPPTTSPLRSMPRPPPAEAEPIEPIEVPPEPQPATVRAVTVSTIPEAEEDEYEDIEIEAAALLPRAAFVRASATPQSSSDPVSKFEHLYDLVRLGDADALHHALTTDFAHAHVDSIWHNDCTLLQVAASWGHAHIVRMLLLLGADPNMCKHASATAAHFAAMNCFKSDEYGEALRALVSYGANLSVKGAGSTWTGEKSPEEVLLLVNRRFAMAQSTSVERRRIGLCLSNMFAYNTSLLPNVTIVLGPTEWRHRIDRALEHWNQHAPEQRGLILYAGAVPADLPAYLIGTRKVPESCVVWAAQVQDTAQAALHAHRMLSHYEGQVILVTSLYHALCAKGYFEPLFAGRLTILPATDDKYDNPKWRTAEAAKLWNDYKGMELAFENYAIARFELKNELQHDNQMRMGQRRPRVQPFPTACWQKNAEVPPSPRGERRGTFTGV